MRIITTVSACALIAFAAPAFAQNNPGTTTKEMQNNGSPNSMGTSKMKQPGAADTQSGTSTNGMSEGRSSATDPDASGATQNGAGGPMKNNVSPNSTNGNMAPGGGPGETGK